MFKSAEFYTAKLYLRAIKDKDVEAIYNIFSDASHIIYLDNKPHYSKDDSWKFIKECQELQKNGKGIFWGICFKYSDRLIGIAGIYDYNKKHFFASIKCVVHKEYTRQGIMTEALKAIINYLFENFDINRLEFQCHVKNIAARRLCEKLHFSNEGLLRKNFYLNGKFYDSYLFTLIKEDYFNT